MREALVAVSAAACLLPSIGCTPTRVASDVPLRVPAQWLRADDSPQRADRYELAHWWMGFSDPQLSELVRKALATSKDLRTARARVQEARAGSVIALSALYPTVDIAGSAGRSKDLTRPVPLVNAAQIGLVASWEPDFFGERRLGAEAASARLLAAEDGYRAALVGLLSEVARNYFELRGAQARKDLVLRNIDVQEETVRLLRARFRAGLSTDFDVSRADASLQTLRSSLPAIEAEILGKVHRLGVLVGEGPQVLATVLEVRKPIPSVEPHIPQLLPSELLAQRPDLRRARNLVSAAAADAGVARTDLFPKFSLMASVGRQVADIGSLPRRTGNIFSLGLGVLEPVFNAGRIRALIDISDARLAQASAEYEQAFLLALEDVENAYVLQRASRERRENLSRATEAALRAERQATILYERGAIDYLALLDSQRTAVATEDAFVNAQTATAVSMVALYRAFGGGWDDEESAASKRETSDRELTELSGLIF